MSKKQPPNGRSYNRMKFLPERRVMMQTCADYLDRRRAGKIEPGPHKALGLTHNPTSLGVWNTASELVAAR